MALHLLALQVLRVNTSPFEGTIDFFEIDAINGFILRDDLARRPGETRYLHPR